MNTATSNHLSSPRDTHGRTSFTLPMRPTLRFVGENPTPESIAAAPEVQQRIVFVGQA